MSLTRDAILKADDLKVEEVDVPEWGGTVKVRTMTAGERDQLEESCVVGTGRKRSMSLARFRAKLVAVAACDDNGDPLFSPSDVEKLSAKSGAAMDRVFAVAQKLAGMSDQDVEELVKN